MKNSIPENEAQVAKLVEYFATMPDGEDLTWLRIESDTDISMTGRGRDFARRALRRAKRPYEAVRGVSIRLSSPSTALSITRGKFLRIDGAVRIADRTQQQLQQRHLSAMTPDEQRKMLIAAGFFGAIRTIARETTVAMLRG